jgi:hypothetical protein
MRVLCRVGQSFADDEVDCTLDLVWEPVFERGVQPGGESRSAAELFQRGSEPSLGEEGRVDPMGQLAQFP